MKEKLFGQKEIEELKESFEESKRQTKERTDGPLDSFNKFKKEHVIEISRLIQVFNNNIWNNKKSVK
jgi:hypothetical protein